MRFKLLAKIHYFVMPMSVSVRFCPFLARFGVIWHDKGSSHSTENYRLPSHCSSLAVSLLIACGFDAHRLPFRCPTLALSLPIACPFDAYRLPFRCSSLAASMPDEAFMHFLHCFLWGRRSLPIYIVCPPI